MDIEQLLRLMKPQTFKAHGLSHQLIVNLTSYPKRYGALTIALTSLLNQSVMADRIILWLWREDYRQLPPVIRQMQQQRLEIRLLEEDYRSFNKIIPALRAFPEAFQVTADDDMIYRPTWLEELVAAHKRTGGIVAQRGHLIQFNPDMSFRPYVEWLRNTPAENFHILNSALLFPTSGAGILYPPHCFDPRMTDAALARKLCPTADDIWLYFMHTLHHRKASLIGGRQLFDIPHPEEDTLWHVNQTANDVQFNAMIRTFGLPEELASEMQRALSVPGGENIVRLRSGQVLSVGNDAVSQEIKATRLFCEEELLSYVKRFFAPKCVMDLRAGIGNYAVGLSGAEGYRAICTESDPALRAMLKDNLHHNGINGKICPAIPDQKNEDILHYTEDNADAAFAPDILRIGQPGSEPGTNTAEILAGAEETIRRHQPTLILQHRNYPDYQACRPRLRTLHYKPVKFFPRTRSLIYINRDRFSFPDCGNAENWADGIWRTEQR